VPEPTEQYAEQETLQNTSFTGGERLAIFMKLFL
jgi:hypothetical protein